MSNVKYAYNAFDEKSARAYGRSLPISTKAAISICSALRGKNLTKAVEYLKRVVELKQAVPFTRFTDGVGHRKGIGGPGRYPVKAAEEIGRILALAAHNANNKGLGENLTIVHLVAQKASSPLHQGRQRRREMKRTHIEVVVRETPGSAKKKQPAPKKEAKKAVPPPKETPKPEEKKSSPSPQKTEDKKE